MKDIGVFAEARVAVTCTSSRRCVLRLSASCVAVAMEGEARKVAVAERTTVERIVVFLFIIQYLFIGIVMQS